MSEPKNGNGTAALVTPEDLARGAMPEGVASLYRAAYEAGYTRGKDDGYSLGFGAGFAKGRQHENISGERRTSANTSAASATRKKGLLGLPCLKCGTFLYSDEAHCPHCRAPRS